MGARPAQVSPSVVNTTVAISSAQDEVQAAVGLELLLQANPHTRKKHGGSPLLCACV